MRPVRIPDAMLTESPDVSALLQHESWELSPQELMAEPMVVLSGTGQELAESSLALEEPLLLSGLLSLPVRPPRRSPRPSWGAARAVLATAKVYAMVKKRMLAILRGGLVKQRGLEVNK